MNNSLIQDITAYFEYLKKQHGLYVAFHNACIPLSGMMAELSRYNINSNPYCLYVKSSDSAWNHCIRRQPKVFDRCESGPFCGTCYAGMGEYVFPITDEEKILGFIDVSGYCFDRELSLSRIRRCAKRYDLSVDALIDSFEKNLLPPISDTALLHTLIAPLCHMFVLLNKRLLPLQNSRSSDTGTLSSVLGHAVVFLERSYTQSIHTADVAHACHCSPSFISHIFKKNMGCSVSDYVNRLRLRDVKRLLADTGLSIQQISDVTGYSTPNYMSEVFRAQTGMTPREYRRIHRLTT